MKVIYNKIIPFKGFRAINLFGVVFARKECSPLSAFTVNHERIHTEQMRELGYVPFYLCYVLEWFVKLCFFGRKSYYHISFEQEACKNTNNLGYYKFRKHYSFLKYILK
jgi:hypothetical protein